MSGTSITRRSRAFPAAHCLLDGETNQISENVQNWPSSLNDCSIRDRPPVQDIQTPSCTSSLHRWADHSWDESMRADSPLEPPHSCMTRLAMMRWLRRMACHPNSSANILWATWPMQQA